jgi:hypothetical protein
VFTDEGWTEPEMLHRYVTGEDATVRDGFEGSVRGLYRLDEQEEEGRIGPVPQRERQRGHRGLFAAVV